MESVKICGHYPRVSRKSELGVKLVTNRITDYDENGGNRQYVQRHA